MITDNKLICEKCGHQMKYYDKVSRIIRMKNRKSNWVKVPRYKCAACGHIKRDLPSNVYPYKQYESEIIDGVLEGLITCETLGYEDYPCEMTMRRWIIMYK